MKCSSCETKLPKMTSIDTLSVEVTCLHHAFLDRLATEPDLRYLKFRVGGLVGPHVIFPYTQDLVAHVASSKKYRRTNPLDSKRTKFQCLFHVCIYMFVPYFAIFCNIFHGIGSFGTFWHS